MLKKKLIATIMTVVMALSLMAPAMAVDAPSKAPTPSTIYKIENIKKGSIQGRLLMQVWDQAGKQRKNSAMDFPLRQVRM